MNGVCLALLSCASIVTAQMLSPDYEAMGAPMSNFLSSSYLTQQVMNDLTLKRGFKGNGESNRTDAAAITFRDSGRPPAMPAKLAQAYPAASRAEVERVFSTLLALYPKVEKYYGWPHNDLAGSVAVFLVSS